MTAFPSKIVAAELDMQQTLINLGIPVAADPVSQLHLTCGPATAEAGSAQWRRKLPNSSFNDKTADYVT
jgi:hypothetical protein